MTKIINNSFQSQDDFEKKEQKSRTRHMNESNHPVKVFFDNEIVRNKFKELLGKRASSFITSVLQIVSQSDMLQKADPATVFQAAAVAATLDLPINQNLGFAYIIPFDNKKTGKIVAQFQMGYKGFIQLAQRSGQFQSISACAIYEGQISEQNPLTGFKFDFSLKKSEKVIGYAAYFKLLNGFEKTLYMTIEELQAHGVRYSQTFKRDFGLWKDNFDSMATKTVIKLLLSKFAPLSIEMQKAVLTDQAVINNSDTLEISYVDNEKVQVDKLQERATLLIERATTIEELEALSPTIPITQQELFLEKYNELSNK